MPEVFFPTRKSAHTNSSGCPWISKSTVKLTSKDLHSLGLVDDVIKEPLGGAHRNIHDTVYNVEKYIVKSLKQLKKINPDKLIEARYKKLRAIGKLQETDIALKTQTGKERIKAALEQIKKTQKLKTTNTI